MNKFDIVTSEWIGSGIMLSVNGEECTLEEYIYTNTQDPSVEHLSQDDINLVKNLKVGESAYFGHGDVKRVE